MPSIYPFFTWCEQTWIGRLITVHESFFPALETLHLFGLVLLLGTIAILSLRLLGLLMPGQRISELGAALDRYTTIGFAIMLPSGVLMFIATAIRCYGNTSFWVKMSLLTAALSFHFAYFRRVVHSPQAHNNRWRNKIAGGGALVLWFGVGMAGRSIGFFG